MSDFRTLDQLEPGDLDLAGGKALALALLRRAGLPVPPGFCVPPSALGRLPDADLIAAIAHKCDKLGPGPFAVRSSAVGEDGDSASLAGLAVSVLDVARSEVMAAIDRCRASLHSERAAAYLRRHGIGVPVMAVLVQQMIPADVSGVMFTHSPDGGGPLVEAVRGPGGVVSGRDIPQRGCLDDEQLTRLAELGRRVEEVCGGPRDIEFAFAGGELWLLQARPITAGVGEREQVRREEIDALRVRAERNGTVWARFGLSESLPEPTPMTWEIIRRYLMSGEGGFGWMYRDLGYDPDPALAENGAFDLVCGRPYCNLSREARLHFHRLPLRYPFAELKAEPRRALVPTPKLDPWTFWLMLPVSGPRFVWQLLGASRRRRRVAETFARRYRDEIAPPFVAAADAAAQDDLTKLDGPALVAYWEAWARRTLVDFGRDALKPTALAALRMAELRGSLAEVVGDDSARSLVDEIVQAARPPAEADVAAAVRQYAAGRLSRGAFLRGFGHRAGGEMELSRPRWCELAEPPSLPHREQREAPPSVDRRWLADARLNAEQRALVQPHVDQLHEWLGLREVAKHDLMRGYARIRAALIELDRRHGLEGGVFFLTPGELPSLLRGDELGPTIASRRKRRALALGLAVPTVLFSDDLKAIGCAVAATGATLLYGTPLSAGVAEGPALILDRPAPPPGDDFILVCPSADPDWVPLFAAARGVVMESGGILSHGAIVAREFGLPAVAGVPGARGAIRPGQRVRIDGGAGTVELLG